jgi:predicted aconitase
MKLSPTDRDKLEGREGPASAMAMSILVRMGEVLEADHMIDIEAAHIDSTLYMGQATLDFAEKLAEMGAKVCVPTSLNVGGVDQQGWQSWPVPATWAEPARRQMDAYQSMGAVPTWTCAPYQTAFRPKFGQQIAWGESNAIVFANSVIGARTERYPDLLDICAAVTGRVPAVGLHLESNRGGQLMIEVSGVPESLQSEDSFYPVFGLLVGKLAGDRIPVLTGLNVQPTEDQLKAFGAATASSGSVALFHWVGVTPEAGTLEMALKGRQPEEVIRVGIADLKAAWRDLTTDSGGKLDMVVLGSPHFSLDEFRRLAPMLDGRSRHPDVSFLVTSSRAMAALAEKAGVLKPLREFGGRVTLDTCILTTPMLPSEVKTLMTNSAKYAYYSPGLLNTQVVFGSLEDCVQSAIEGRVVRDESLWAA